MQYRIVSEGGFPGLRAFLFLLPSLFQTLFLAFFFLSIFQHHLLNLLLVAINQMSESPLWVLSHFLQPTHPHLDFIHHFPLPLNTKCVLFLS